jgi:hypothetical protein
MFHANHILNDAKWIWPDPRKYLYNNYAWFRKDFELAVVPATVPFFITADKCYRLYVNGAYVCRGPARGYQDHWPFDEVDISRYLRVGANRVTVEAYTPGIGTFQYIHKSIAGMLCAADIGEVKIRSDLSWKMRRSTGHRVMTARYSVQLDFQEDFDAAVDGRDWIHAQTPPADAWSTEDNSWEAFSDDYEVPPHVGMVPGEITFGRPPWDTVEPRGIPHLADSFIAPVGITAHAVGKSGRDYKTRENISWGWIGEGKKVSAWDSGKDIAARSDNGWLEFELAPVGQGSFRAVTLDLGKIYYGHLEISAVGATGGEIIDFQYDQCLRDGKPAFIQPGNACNIALANRLHLAPGKTEHDFYHMLAFRNVTVIARDVTSLLKLKIRMREYGYPFSMQGVFECSDQTLNGIHAACRHTQKICSLDAYVDTPWREQAQWWGDARVQAWNTFYLDGDARLFARGIRSIAGQRTSHGLTYGHAPTIAYNCILPDFALTWIMTNWDYYWQTGEIDLFKEMLPVAEGIFSYFDSPRARGAHGLLRHDERFWYFGDWAPLYKGYGEPTLLNLYYLLALDAMAKMLRAAGLTDKALDFEKRLTEHTTLARKYFYNPETKLMFGGLEADGTPSGVESVHDQILALMLELVPEAEETMINEIVLPCLRGEEMTRAQPSAFWSAYMLTEMGRRGYRQECMDYIRRGWEPMLSTGTTWEIFTWNETNNHSCTHAWSAHPCYHLVNLLAGVRQTAPGWREVEIDPFFAPGIASVKAVIPAPRGKISVSWQLSSGKPKVDLDLPEDVKLAGR